MELSATEFHTHYTDDDVAAAAAAIEYHRRDNHQSEVELVQCIERRLAIIIMV